MKDKGVSEHTYQCCRGMSLSLSLGIKGQAHTILMTGESSGTRGGGETGMRGVE